MLLWPLWTGPKTGSRDRRRHVRMGNNSNVTLILLVCPREPGVHAQLDLPRAIMTNTTTSALMNTCLACPPCPTDGVLLHPEVYTSFIRQSNLVRRRIMWIVCISRLVLDQPLCRPGRRTVKTSGLGLCHLSLGSTILMTGGLHRAGL